MWFQRVRGEYDSLTLAIGALLHMDRRVWSSVHALRERQRAVVQLLIQYSGTRACRQVRRYAMVWTKEVEDRWNKVPSMWVYGRVNINMRNCMYVGKHVGIGRERDQDHLYKGTWAEKLEGERPRSIKCLKSQEFAARHGGAAAFVDVPLYVMGVGATESDLHARERVLRRQCGKLNDASDDTYGKDVGDVLRRRAMQQRVDVRKRARRRRRPIRRLRGCVENRAREVVRVTMTTYRVVDVWCNVVYESVDFLNVLQYIAKDERVMDGTYVCVDVLEGVNDCTRKVPCKRWYGEAMVEAMYASTCGKQQTLRGPLKRMLWVSNKAKRLGMCGGLVRVRVLKQPAKWFSCNSKGEVDLLLHIARHPHGGKDVLDGMDYSRVWRLWTCSKAIKNVRLREMARAILQRVSRRRWGVKINYTPVVRWPMCMDFPNKVVLDMARQVLKRTYNAPRALVRRMCASVRVVRSDPRTTGGDLLNFRAICRGYDPQADLKAMCV